MSVTSMPFSSVSTGTITSTDRSSSSISSGLPYGASQQQIQNFGEDTILDFPKFTEEEIKGALKAEAEKHAMWKTAAVKKMKILDINTSVAIRYTLETFTETRSTFEVTEQYSGPPVDICRGTSPSVWDIECHPTKMFCEDTLTQELPGSACTMKCESCNGQSESYCYHCKGTGTTKCNLCNGTGMRSGVPHPLVGPGVTKGMKSGSGNGRSQFGLGTPVSYDNNAVIAVSSAGLTAMHLCDKCGGRGTRECSRCNGQGKNCCASCNGSGRMKRCTMLKIRYELDKSEYLDGAGLSDDIFRRVTGEVVMRETRPLVSKVTNFPIPAINDQSDRLIKCHLAKHQNCAKILQQRHMIEAIPVACVAYDFNGQRGSCWVVGLERVAYVPQYPKKCCIL